MYSGINIFHSLANGKLENNIADIYRTNDNIYVFAFYCKEPDFWKSEKEKGT